MEVPAETAGVIKEVKAVVGGKISEGDVIAILSGRRCVRAGPGRHRCGARSRPGRGSGSVAAAPPPCLPRRRLPAAAKSACRTSAATTASM